MISFEQLNEPRPGHGLQAMMQRWEQHQAVNAVHIARFRRRISPQAAEAAAQRVLERLLQVSHVNDAAAPIESKQLFDFQSVQHIGHWQLPLEETVSQELNTPFLDGTSPFRVRLIEATGQETFLVFVYRHVIADARAVALVVHELLCEINDGDQHPASSRAVVGGPSLREMFREEFQWHRWPAIAWHLVREWCRARRCVRLQPAVPNDLRMVFQIHETALPLQALKDQCCQFGATVNDLLLAAVLEWFAARLPGNRLWRKNLSAAVLVDLSHRGDTTQSKAFGQFVSQFVVRASASSNCSLSEILQRVSAQTSPQKHNRPLIYNSIGFELLARLWDLFAFVREPSHLAGALPLLAGVSNVNLKSIVVPDNTPAIVDSYYRGTCVTSMLPVMVSITSVHDTVSLTTTHRPALFTSDEIKDLARHVCCRLFGATAEGVTHRAA